MVSEEIGYIKSQVISKIINNPDILALINEDMINKPNKYINKHIFKFVKVPPTIEEETTYVCVEVYIPTDHSDNITKELILEIHVFAHINIQDVPEHSGTRPDEISALLEPMLCDKDLDIGSRKLKMLSNTPNAYTTTQYGRVMRFSISGINRKSCS